MIDIEEPQWDGFEKLREFILRNYVNDNDSFWSTAWIGFKKLHELVLRNHMN